MPRPFATAVTPSELNLVFSQNRSYSGEKWPSAWQHACSLIDAIGCVMCRRGCIGLTRALCESVCVRAHVCVCACVVLKLEYKIHIKTLITPETLKVVYWTFTLDLLIRCYLEFEVTSAKPDPRIPKTSCNFLFVFSPLSQTSLSFSAQSLYKSSYL